MNASLRLAEPQDSPPVPILVVDDNPAKRLALKSVLLPLGYSIVEADSGLAALRCVRKQNFAVILLDVLMPIMDGFETAELVRQRRQSEMTPIIFITAHGKDEILHTDLYAQGAVDFIFAPVPPEELRAKVSVFANLFSKAEELATAAREVQKSADQLRLLADAAPIGIFQTDVHKRFVYTNPRWAEITGISSREAFGRSWDTLVGSEKLAGLISELSDDAASTDELCNRFEIVVPGSASRIALTTSRSIPDDDGGVAGWVGTVADVTAAEHEREADLARRAAEEQYRRIVETTMEGIWLVDAENRTTFVNDAMARMLATTPAEMQGRPTVDYVVGDEGSSHEGRSAGVSEHYEVKLLRSDGTEMYALVSATALLDESGAYIGSLKMIRDDTERVEQDEKHRDLEEQLRQSQRLESIGRLAGGIAHDFNNLLLGIRGFGELALRGLERGEDNAAAGVYINDMLGAAERATLLTGQLLAFGRGQVLQPEVVDLGEVVGSMEKLLRQLIGEHVELVTLTPDEPVLVEADRAQLGQVITNLAVNARDAMPERGRLVIAVSRLDGEIVEAVLTVTDNGSGMDEETAVRAFEPFFTTKGAGGSGFGLATVHGIVNQSGGRIAVDSRPGEGSTFSVFLPLSELAPAPAGLALSVAEGGADTILLVDDDTMVRRIVTAMLENLGYKVISAGGGAEALEVAEAWTAEINLVLTDLSMPPGPGGRETAERICRLFPGTRVLYMSGYTDDLTIRGGDFEPGIGYIQKPFGAEQLGQRVREVLELAVE
jgi:PAS domain S-box-containing protein